MVEQDKKQFSEIFFAVAQLYEKEMNKMKLSVYFSALQNYSISQVQEGVNKHVKNTETGSFMPKPSDIIKQLEGTQKDAQRQLVKLYQNMNTKPLDQLPDNVKGLEDIQKLKGESIGIMQNLEDRFAKEFGGAK